MLSLETKKKESIQIKAQAKELSEKLAHKYAVEYFNERIAGVAPVDDTRKQELINRIALQYQPYYYRDIILKVMYQKIIEEKKSVLTQKNYQPQEQPTQNIDSHLLETSKNISNLMKENYETDSPDEISQNINKIVMSVLDKK